MNLAGACAAIRAAAPRTRNDFISLLFICCTLAVLCDVVRMWSHWFEISAALGFFRAAGTLAAVTGASIAVSWWVNTGNT